MTDDLEATRPSSRAREQTVEDTDTDTVVASGRRRSGPSAAPVAPVAGRTAHAPEPTERVYAPRDTAPAVLAARTTVPRTPAQEQVDTVRTEAMRRRRARSRTAVAVAAASVVAVAAGAALVVLLLPL